MIDTPVSAYDDYKKFAFIQMLSGHFNLYPLEEEALQKKRLISANNKDLTLKDRKAAVLAARDNIMTLCEDGEGLSATKKMFADYNNSRFSTYYNKISQPRRT